METPGPEPVPEPRRGAPARAVEWSRVRAQRASAWSLDARGTHRSVDVGFRLADRDKRVAAGVLAGGVAYRLFFWLLSISVLATGAFGIAHGEWLDEVLRDLGLGPATSSIVKQFLRGTEQARWWVILVGGWLVLWTGYLGAKALVLVHAAVWGVPAPRARRAWAMSLTFTGTTIAFLAAMSLAAKVHFEGHLVGLPLRRRADRHPVRDVARRVELVAAPGNRLARPRAGRGPGGDRDAGLLPVRHLLPGAEAGQRRPAHGLLGIAATVLFWLYVLGRLTIGAATLNASLYENRAATEPPADG